jgi:hypothetical protein
MQDETSAWSDIAIQESAAAIDDAVWSGWLERPS